MLRLLSRHEEQEASVDAARFAKPASAEILSLEAAAAHAADWQRLAENCLEPNAFFAPGFALAAARHLGKGRAPRFLFIWEGESAATRKLLAVCPLAPSSRLARLKPARIWTHEQAPLGTPLLDCARAEDALAALFAHCRTHLPHAAGLMFPTLPLEGPVARLILARAAVEARKVRFFGAHQRAILAAGAEPKRYLEQSVTSKRRRKLNKARKSLEAMGAVTFRIIRDPSELRMASEEFLALEAKGWKGKRGTALLNAPDRVAFVRSLAASRGHDRNYFMASLELDGLPLAMAIMLESGSRAYWWKITYDEDFAAYSPGVLLALEVTRSLLCDAKIALTDSCTTGPQPMIDHIWSERMALADLFVATAPGTSRGFAATASFEAVRRRLRSGLKEIVLCLRQWKRLRGCHPAKRKA